MKNNIATVNFHGNQLTVITSESGQRLVAMKPIVEGIGLQWGAQYNRIQRHPVLSEGISVMDMPSSRGVQKTVCLELDYINGWLFGVDVSRCKKEIQPALIAYQRECYSALAAYWQENAAPKLKPTTKALPGCLTTDQQDAIKEMVRARVETLPHEKQKGAAIRCWSSLKSKFGVTYKEIPSELYPEAVSLLARLPLDGEVIEKQPDQDIIQQAFGFGATVAGEVVKSMVAAMIEGSTDLSLDRWIVSLNEEGKPYARAIDRQAIVCSIPKLAQEIGAPCGIMATDKELLELAMACNHALSIRLRGRGASA